MQHIQSSAMHFEGHSSVWRIVTYLTLALAALIAVFEHNPGFLVVLAIVFVIVLALTERTRKIETGLPVNPEVSASRLLGDGGSFPGTPPEKVNQDSGASPLHDGGIL